MPVFVYILLGIALLITILLFAKVKVYIVYDDSLKVYAKLWFIRINISILKLLGNAKKKKQKKKEKAQKKLEALGADADIKKQNPILLKLTEIKVVLDALFVFLKKIHFRFLKLRINVACEDAATTALVYAGATQGVSYIIELLRNISKVDMVKNSDVLVNADFISRKPEFEAKIVLHFLLKDYIIFNYLKEPREKKGSRNKKED